MQRMHLRVSRLTDTRQFGLDPCIGEICGRSGGQMSEGPGVGAGAAYVPHNSILPTQIHAPTLGWTKGECEFRWAAAHGWMRKIEYHAYWSRTTEAPFGSQYV